MQKMKTELLITQLPRGHSIFSHLITAYLAVLSVVFGIIRNQTEDRIKEKGKEKHTNGFKHAI